MNLPHHRKYNWKLVWRSVRPICAWLSLLALLGLMLVGMEQFGNEHLARLDAEYWRASAQLEQIRLATIGKPGYTRTDWTEGTVDIEVRNP